jgi:hypothetical protein
MSGAFGGRPTLSEPSGEVRGLGLVLPGRAYPPDAPLLWFARQALGQHGFAVQEVWWDARDLPDDVEGWVRDQAAAACPEDAPAAVVVAKSLGTHAAAWAAEHGYDAIWLTPILGDGRQVAAIGANRGRQLLIGGAADPFWDTAVADRLTREGCEVMEIPDADHALCVPGDVVRSAEIHVQVTRRMDAFLTGLETS